MKKEIQYVAAIALLALLILSTCVMAQPNPGSGGNPGGGPPVGGGVPIDGGIGILIALALSYGMRRWYVVHKQKTTEE